MTNTTLTQAISNLIKNGLRLKNVFAEAFGKEDDPTRILKAELKKTRPPYERPVQLIINRFDLLRRSGKAADHVLKSAIAAWWVTLATYLEEPDKDLTNGGDFWNIFTKHQAPWERWNPSLHAITALEGILRRWKKLPEWSYTPMDPETRTWTLTKEQINEIKVQVAATVAKSLSAMGFRAA